MIKINPYETGTTDVGTHKWKRNQNTHCHHALLWGNVYYVPDDTTFLK